MSKRHDQCKIEDAVVVAIVGRVLINTAAILIPHCTKSKAANFYSDRFFIIGKLHFPSKAPYTETTDTTTT